MNGCAHFSARRIALTLVLVATAGFVACNQSKPAGVPATSAAMAAASEQVFVILEGPWAIVDDPKDANSILALAPHSAIHNELYVAASNDSLLAPGKYDLSVPAHGAAATGALDPTFAQAKISASGLQHALDQSGRYVIRLPKPEAYAAAKRFVSRVGASYPPDASTEQNYAVFVSLRYSVASLSGFSVTGTPDSGTFNPLLLQLDTPYIRFAIEPAGPDDLTDQCHTHSRKAFRDTVQYLGLTLFVDFPHDPDGCHSADPQRATKVRASSTPDSRRGLIAARTANVRAGSFPGLMAALLLFHATDGSCKAPILFLTTTP